MASVDLLLLLCMLLPLLGFVCWLLLWLCLLVLAGFALLSCFVGPAVAAGEHRILPSPSPHLLSFGLPFSLPLVRSTIPVDYRCYCCCHTHYIVSHFCHVLGKVADPILGHRLASLQPRAAIASEPRPLLRVAL